MKERFDYGDVFIRHFAVNPVPDSSYRPHFKYPQSFSVCGRRSPVSNG